MYIVGASVFLEFFIALTKREQVFKINELNCGLFTHH